MTAGHTHASVSQIAELARKLQAHALAGDVTETLGELLDSAVECVPGAAHAAITTASRDEVLTVVATGGWPTNLREIQQRHKGLYYRQTSPAQFFRIDDMTTDRRWPVFCRDVVNRTPIRSILAIPLSADRHQIGVVYFYAERPHAFDAESTELGLVAATYIALAWHVLRHDQQTQTALASRDVIGQAKGIVMERLNIDGTRAFDVLRELSQNSNTPVAEIARRLVEKEHPARPGNPSRAWDHPGRFQPNRAASKRGSF